jgi:hypothetical protein
VEERKARLLLRTWMKDGIVDGEAGEAFVVVKFEIQFRLLHLCVELKRRLTSSYDCLVVRVKTL